MSNPTSNDFVEKAWKEYEQMRLPPGLPKEVLAAIKDSFFAGAGRIVAFMIEDIRPVSKEVTEYGLSVLRKGGMTDQQIQQAINAQLQQQQSCNHKLTSFMGRIDPPK